MDILVIGGTRFMGKHLVKELLLEGHNVTIATRGNVRDDFSDEINRIKMDRLDGQSIKENLSCKHYDVVYDSLAYCSNDMKRLLEHICCDRYIFISTTAVYDKHIDTKEEDFDPFSKPLVWCERFDFPYDETKRQAERALVQSYSKVNSVAVRFPFVTGEDDYTNRLFFYVEHIMSRTPMYVDNFENQMAFVRSDEAGKFLCFLAQNDFCGNINGASGGTISIKDIADYINDKTGREIILREDGDEAPYNGENAYSINTDKANKLGFHFSPLHNWIFDLLDKYIEQV